MHSLTAYPSHTTSGAVGRISWMLTTGVSPATRCVKGFAYNTRDRVVASLQVGPRGECVASQNVFQISISGAAVRFRLNALPSESLQPASLLSKTWVRSSRWSIRSDVVDDPALLMADDAIGSTRVRSTVLLQRPGTRIRDFKSARQLCIALRDVLRGAFIRVEIARSRRMLTLDSLAHGVMYMKVDMIHRDIAEGNILISGCTSRDSQVEGLLVDWDLTTASSPSSPCAPPNPVRKPACFDHLISHCRQGYLDICINTSSPQVSAIPVRRIYL